MTPLDQEVDELVATHASGLQAFAGKHVLLTGCAGFLGTWYLAVLAAFNRARPNDAIRVSAYDVAGATSPLLARFAREPSITIASHDVTKPCPIDAPPDFILHAASIASPVFYRQKPLQTIDVNVNGTWRLLELAQAHPGCRMLYLSSSEIYGDPAASAIPTPEGYWGHVSCTGPRACYDESKRLGETLAMTFHREFGVPVYIVRPFNVYGPAQSLNDQRIIPDLMKAALAGGPITLFSDGTPTRSFCYVADFIMATLSLLSSPHAGEPFNIGNDEEISIGEAARIVAELAGGAAPLAVAMAKSPDPRYLVDNPNRRSPDLTKMKTLLDWQPTTMFREGAARTLAYYRRAS